MKSKCSRCGNNNIRLFKVMNLPFESCNDCGMFWMISNERCDDPSCSHCNPSLEQQKEIENKLC